MLLDDIYRMKYKQQLKFYVGSFKHIFLKKNVNFSSINYMSR